MLANRSGSGTVGEVLSLEKGERKVIQKGGILGRYLPTGHLLYISRNTLFAAPFDLSGLRASGSSREILEDMGSRMEGWNSDFSEAGSFVYLSQSHEPQLSIFWLDQTGKLSPLQTTPGTYASPRFSPDGRRLAFSMSGRGSQNIWLQDIWVQDLVRVRQRGSRPCRVPMTSGLDARRLEPDFPFRERLHRWIRCNPCRRKWHGVAAVGVELGDISRIRVAGRKAACSLGPIRGRHDMDTFAGDRRAGPATPLDGTYYQICVQPSHAHPHCAGVLARWEMARVLFAGIWRD
jgi:hypothetical protein